MVVMNQVRGALMPHLRLETLSVPVLQMLAAAAAQAIPLARAGAEATRTIMVAAVAPGARKQAAAEALPVAAPFCCTLWTH